MQLALHNSKSNYYNFVAEEQPKIYNEENTPTQSYIAREHTLVETRGALSPGIFTSGRKLKSEAIKDILGSFSCKTSNSFCTIVLFLFDLHYKQKKL